MKTSISATGAALAALAALALASPNWARARASGGLVWPNAESSANSDPWIAQHHDELVLMRPRVLVVNFVNGMSAEQARQKAHRLARAIGESSRDHGYARPEAPVFLDYQIAAVVDLTDDAAALASSAPSATATAGPAAAEAPRTSGPPESLGLVRALGGGGTARDCACPTPVAATKDLPDPTGPYEDRFGTPDGNSTRYPRIPNETQFNLDYAALCGMLDLKTLVDRGLVNEVWVIAHQVDGVGGPAETAEQVRVYDANRRQLPEVRNASNGVVFPSVGLERSLRIVFINADRGVGCGMHSLGHSLEFMAYSGAIPYFTHYFREYAQLDLDERFALPARSFYDLDGARLSYPAPDRLVIDRNGVQTTVDGYAAKGGNCHFPPNAREAYDYTNDQPVLSTIEHWRRRELNGADRAEPWTPARFASLAGTAPDGTCGGDWLVYWRQNMPGLGNQARDDSGKPMKNWWPFLFY